MLCFVSTTICDSVSTSRAAHSPRQPNQVPAHVTHALRSLQEFVEAVPRIRPAADIQLSTLNSSATRQDNSIHGYRADSGRLSLQGIMSSTEVCYMLQ